jgi:hypothetical protein
MACYHLCTTVMACYHLCTTRHRSRSLLPAACCTSCHLNNTWFKSRHLQHTHCSIRRGCSTAQVAAWQHGSALAVIMSAPRHTAMLPAQQHLLTQCSSIQQHTGMTLCMHAIPLCQLHWPHHAAKRHGCTVAILMSTATTRQALQEHQHCTMQLNCQAMPCPMTKEGMPAKMPAGISHRCCLRHAAAPHNMPQQRQCPQNTC